MTPCVVLAHGLSAVRDQSLDRYAERFAEAGLTAIVFEYRHFGDSGGAPRQLLDIDRQLDDWRAAIACARTLDGVEPTRVAIWGTSLSGGHVITLAADDPSVAAVVSQVAFADGLVTVRRWGSASRCGSCARDCATRSGRSSAGRRTRSPSSARPAREGC